MELPVPGGVQREEVVTCSQVADPSAQNRGQMSFKESFIKVAAEKLWTGTSRLSGFAYWLSDGAIALGTDRPSGL